MNTLELLLNAGNMKLPEKEVKLKRLSKELNGDVVFKIKAMTYNTVAEIKDMHSGPDMEVHIVLNGVVYPNLRSEELKQKYNAVTPVEMIKTMLLPGEIEDISREIEKLSGYRVTTVEEIKKK